MRRTWAAAACIGLLFVGACGGGSDKDPVARAGASLSRVHSGVLHLRLELGTSPDDPAGRVGFQIDGSFELSSGRPLPVADLTSTNLNDPSNPATRLVSTGEAAFIVKDGVGYQLDDAHTAVLRRDVAGDGSSTLQGIELQHWVAGSTSSAPSDMNGEPVDRITGPADPVEVLNGITALAGQLGAGDQASLRVDAADADRVRAATTSTSLELLTGHDDHLLRSLQCTIEFSAAHSSAAGAGGVVLAALQRVGHLALSLELTIQRPNAPVTVSAPDTVKPISALPR